MASEALSEEIEIGLKEIPEILRYEWRRRTWYGRLFYPAVLITALLLVLLIVLARAMLRIDAIWESYIAGRWPSKFKEEYTDH